MSEDWQKVKSIFNAALDRPEGERPYFVAAACGGDAELHSQVEKLLSSYDSDFLESTVQADKNAAVDRLAAGDTIGHYEIVQLLGIGGMGEVYLAKDLSLDRKVAIKVLNEKYEQNETNVDRFIQEAKAA